MLGVSVNNSSKSIKLFNNGKDNKHRWRKKQITCPYITKHATVKERSFHCDIDPEQPSQFYNLSIYAIEISNSREISIIHVVRFILVVTSLSYGSTKTSFVFKVTLVAVVKGNKKRDFIKR